MNQSENKVESGLSSAVTPVLELRGITKVFPGVKALDHVDFDVLAGEVHALVGENGAGKSTLMKILAGNYRPDEGVIRLEGRPVHFQNPLAAKRHGVLLVHQELSLVPQLSVAENIFLGSLPRRSLARVDWPKLNGMAAEILHELGCEFAPTDATSKLSLAKQQMVEIARALAFQPRVVIFDEPTASLTQHEQGILFDNILRLKQRGVALIYISHKLDEVFSISKRITVLRDGRNQGTLETAHTNEGAITAKMIGRGLSEYFEKGARNAGREVLRVDQLTVGGVFQNVSFSVRQGEVLGLYGLVGAGRSELAETIFGIRSADSGTIMIDGARTNIHSSADAMRFGIGLVPESRKDQGLVLGMGGRDNMTLPIWFRLQTAGFTQNRAATLAYEGYRRKLLINATGPRQPVVNLSGGNQQKIVIAKWLLTKPKLLILDEPTRGIDVGAKSEIHKLIGDLAQQGIAVIVISSEMPEVIGVSHRILTMYKGRLTGEFLAEEVTEEKLVHAITSGSSTPERK
jgi:ribose transport system ATP-binding protein